MAEQRLETEKTSDARFRAIIRIFDVLRLFTAEEQVFILETVARNLDLKAKYDPDYMRDEQTLLAQMEGERAEEGKE